MPIGRSTNTLAKSNHQIYHSNPSLTSHQNRTPISPLYSHASGKWAKKIRGGAHYFGTWDDYHKTRKRIIRGLGKRAIVGHLRPEDFGRLRQTMGKELSPTTLHNRIGLLGIIGCFLLKRHSPFSARLEPTRADHARHPTRASEKSEAWPLWGLPANSCVAYPTRSRLKWMRGQSKRFGPDRVRRHFNSAGPSSESTVWKKATAARCPRDAAKTEI